MAIAYEWRGRFADAELVALHAEGFGTAPAHDDWWRRVQRHSLGWVCARDGANLVGFVNVAWDGANHAFILDTVVAEDTRRQGVGAGLIRYAAAETRAAGATWLHVDFEPHLRAFYLDSCGFTPTEAGLIALAPDGGSPPRPDVG